VVGTWLKWRPGRALQGKWRQLIGKVGEWYVVSRHLQDYSPRLCWLRTDGLAPVSKYWTYWSHVGDMSPVSLVAVVNRCLALPPLLHWLARERNWVWTCGSVSRRVVDCVGSPFSREQWSCSTMLMTSWMVAICGPHDICMVLDHTWIECGKHVVCWSGFLLHSVHRTEREQSSRR
jgi:hypothetical protein